MVEINPKNVKISKKIFGSKANICCADFLKDSEKCFRQFGVDKFDIIIGNPPFQDKAGKGGKNKLYEKIICKCLDILNKNTNSYLLFLVPDNLFSGNSSKTYLKFQI
jgi:16S rRNA G1207 methylase RsmC